MPSSPRKLSFSGGTLLLEGVSRGEITRLVGSTPWVWDRRVGAWRCDAMEYVAVGDRLRADGVPFDDTVPAWRCVLRKRRG